MAVDAAVDAPVDAAFTDVKDAATRCRYPCLFLVDTPIAKAVDEGLIAKECGGKTLFDDEADCEERLYALNCIYAAHGKVFKTAAWKDAFTKDPWYRPDPAFVDSGISPLETANVRALKEQHRTCKAAMSAPVSEADIATVNKFLDQVSGAMDDDSTPEFARDLGIRNMNVYDGTKYTYAAPPRGDRRTVKIAGLYHYVGGGEPRPDLEITLVIEGDKVVDSE